MSAKHDRLRMLPKVGDLLDSQQWGPLQQGYRRELVKGLLEQVLDEQRREILDGGEGMVDSGNLLQLVTAALESLVDIGPRPVLNATGVVLHTNLGRAPLAGAARQAALATAGYCNLEIDLAQGVRGSRHDHVEELLCRLTGAQAAMVVNNNAAGVMLALCAVAGGGEAVISRGQLVEIGGSFRVPDVMAQSGVILREVGTTNKTYIDDYRQAISENTTALVRVHPSNFRVVGFQHEVELAQMVDLAHSHELPLIDDLGSGTMVDLSQWGIDEPTVQESVATGADLVCFSGDKLLGGPQCGVVVGGKKWIEKLKGHPLARVLRCDKLTLASLAATLALYMKPDGWKEVPVLAMLTEPLEQVEQRARQLATALSNLPLPVTVEESHSPVGGGALPLHQLETRVVSIDSGRQTEKLAAELRKQRPPLIARIQEDRLLLDVRTLAETEIQEAARTVAAAVEVLSGE